MRSLLFAGLLLLLAPSAYAQLSPPNAAGVTFGHMHLNVADVDVQKKIFVDVFGGTFMQKGAIPLVKFPNMIVAFRKSEAAASSQGSVLDHFGFRVRDIAAMRTELTSLGYTVQPEFKGAEGFQNAYADVADGLRIEMQQDTTLTVKALPNHVHFYVPDVGKALAWYVDTFALTKRNRGRIATTADVGTVNLSFMKASKPIVATKGRVIDHVGFEVANLDVFAKQLEAQGIKLDVPVQEVPSLGLKIAFFTDPDGTYIELTEGLTRY